MNENKTNINWYPGHMARAMHEIKKDLKLIDIVLIILDARVPYASLNKEVYELVKSKTVIMVLNKKDLASITALKRAEDKYKKDGCYTAIVNSITGEGIDTLINLIKEIGERVKYKDKTSSDFKKVNPVYRALVVGMPNVGKSSVINKMSGRKSAEVGNKPGITRKRQWIKVGNMIEIMDTPGVFPKSIKEEGLGEKLALAYTIKDEILDLEILSYYLINILMSNDLYEAMFKARFDLDSSIDSMSEHEILDEIGRKRGALLPGDRVDRLKAAKMLIDDFRTGKIGKISLE